MLKIHRLSCAVLLTAALSSASSRADQWTAPTKEELSMTSIPEVPGAPAVILFEQQTTEDKLHAHSIYKRIKILTEVGKDYANVELPFVAGSQGYSIQEVEGRTIHSDGTVIPFTGKPYEKLVTKGSGYKVKELVFSLPDVGVGSILEYRYKVRWGDNLFFSPDWFIQGDLFVRKGHYMWQPKDQDLVDEKGNLVSGRYAWAPILPPGAEVKIKPVQITNGSEFTLDVHDIPPTPNEEYMPPMGSLSYRVNFYYTQYKSGADFWAHEGKTWSKDRDKFIGTNSHVKEFAATLVTASDSPRQKADKLYAAVMALENTDFTREHERQEDKAEGLREIKNTDDVLARKRGSGNQLAELYVGLARATGLKAYLVGVSDRKEHFFIPMYFNLRQIDDYIALLPIDGKDVFYDPGQRFCEPGHLAWNHTLAGGLRQTDSGAELMTTKAEEYRFNHIARTADLSLDETGSAQGNVTLTLSGDPALYWRQRELKEDDDAVKAALKRDLEEKLPGGVEVQVQSVANLADPSKPLVVIYHVKGAMGSPAGKRLMLPADVFVANTKPAFTAAKRELPVDMHYSSYSQDAVRWKLPPALAIESVPDPGNQRMSSIAQFDISNRKAPNSLTTFRNVAIATPFFTAPEYPELHAFYEKLAAKDQDTIVLNHASTATPAVASKKPSGN